MMHLEILIKNESDNRYDKWERAYPYTEIKFSVDNIAMMLEGWIFTDSCGTKYRIV